MNSQAVMNAIANYRTENGGQIPALLIVHEKNIECIDYNTLVQRSQIVDEHRICDEYRVFIINYSIQNFYQDNFPVLIDKHSHTTIKDYLFYLLEDETRP